MSLTCRLRHAFRYRTDIILYVFLMIQAGLWFGTKRYLPDMSIVPPVPSALSVKAMAFGDDAFYFRTQALKIQNAGDTFGRFTALYKYDYKKLYRWFTLLDSLDSKSNFVPAMAAYYYSQSQHVADVKYIVKYLEEHSEKDLYDNWWWMGQAVYLANNKLHDKKWALELAKKLASTPRNDIPFWAKQMPAFIYEQMGEDKQALTIIASILNNVDKIPPGELNFMRYFVKDRLKAIIARHPELKRIMHEQKVGKDSDKNKE